MTTRELFRSMNMLRKWKEANILKTNMTLEMKCKYLKNVYPKYQMNWEFGRQIPVKYETNHIGEGRKKSHLEIFERTKVTDR